MNKECLRSLMKTMKVRSLSQESRESFVIYYKENELTLTEKYIMLTE